MTHPTQDQINAALAATCAFTGSKENLSMHAHRNDKGEMVGWIFASKDVSDKLATGEYKLTYTLSDTCLQAMQAPTDDVTEEQFHNKCKEYWIWNNRTAIIKMIRREWPNGIRITCK